MIDLRFAFGFDLISPPPFWRLFECLDGHLCRITCATATLITGHSCATTLLMVVAFSFSVKLIHVGYSCGG